MRAVEGDDQLVALVKQLQHYSIDALVNSGDSKNALKIFRKFGFSESDAPNVRILCERKALAWHVSTQHMDLLEGLLRRRYV